MPDILTVIACFFVLMAVAPLFYVLIAFVWETRTLQGGRPYKPTGVLQIPPDRSVLIKLRGGGE